MKRSGNVGLVLMGGVAFATTFAGGMAYFAGQKPSHAASSPAQSQLQSLPAQPCTAQSGSAQNCEPERRGIASYIYPRSSTGWYWSWGPSWSSSSEPRRHEAALTNGNARGHAPAGGATERSGFGSSAKGSFRVSAGG